MDVLLLLVIGAGVGGSVLLVAGELWRSRVERIASLGRIYAYRRPADDGRPARRRRHELAAPAALRRLSLRLSGRSEEGISAALVAAGLGGRISASGLLSLELAVGAGLAALGLLVGSGGGRPLGLTLLLAMVLGGVGAALPYAFVRAQRARRVERIRSELPDVLDLLAVSVSAGLGLEAAIAKLAEAMRGPLAEELTVVLTETRIGASRARALRRMAERLDAPEVSALVRALVQGEQLGVSLAATLRTQAAEARSRRRIAAEERANKASVKMLFPTALLIFPALFIVVLAPAIMLLKSGAF